MIDPNKTYIAAGYFTVPTRQAPLVMWSQPFQQGKFDSIGRKVEGLKAHAVSAVRYANSMNDAKWVKIEVYELATVAATYSPEEIAQLAPAPKIMVR